MRLLDQTKEVGLKPELLEIESDLDALLVSIGDVSKMIGVPTHTIRYWEKEFPQYLNPSRTMGKQRRYGTDEILRLKHIFGMLKEEGYSIAGARRVLAIQNKKADTGPHAPVLGSGEITAENLLKLLKQHLEESVLR